MFFVAPRFFSKITFSKNSFEITISAKDPDRAAQNVGSDLDPNFC